MNGRVGFLSGTGLVAGLITPFAIAFANFLTGGGIFSPGALSMARGPLQLGGAWSHSELRCGQCHAPFWSSQRMSDRCLACHSDIQAELTSSDSLHSIAMATAECRQCHTEHQGPEASLTNVQREDFPHDVFGFSLLAHSSHARTLPLDCQDCHTESLRTFPAGRCLECHAQSDQPFVTDHTLAYGSDCLACHDGVDTYGKAFDHQAASFPLMGKHLGLPCTSCHQGATSAQALQSTPSTCLACHQADDVHQGRLGEDCASCHSPEDWSAVVLDHGKTRFPLVGSHASVECQSCHVDGQMAGIPTDCVGCHLKDDVHGGQLGTSCADCHRPTSWDDVVDENLDHALTRFPLTGAHVTVACQACHLGGQFQGTPTACASCHAPDDVHAGQYGADCAFCHTTSSWKPSTFDHNSTAFPLTGGHQAAPCAMCHSTGGFKGTPAACIACHQQDDKHNGQLGANCGACHNTTSWTGASINHNQSAFPLTGAHAQAACGACHVNGIYKGTPTACIACHRQDDKHNGQFGTNCAACHNTTSWAGATFDHSKTAFPLTGTHVLAACGACHANGVYKGTPTACIACHQQDDKHNGQYGSNCAACHNTTSWAGASINHNQSAFPLTGAHAQTACGACHVNGVYKGTPTACIACHQQDDKHNGQFGTNCEACHNTTSWAGATFDHSRTAFPLTGAHVLAACGACHVNGAYKGTPTACIACHQQDDKHNGQFGTNCAACHNTTSWAGASFDHGKTAFPLTGAHASVPCTSCHPNGVYKGTPAACASCHADPAYHAGLFGSSCQNCHNTTAWRPAQYNRSHAFPMRHGGADSNCRTCHPTSLASYTCYQCHDQARIAAVHRERGIPDFSNCMACHRNGQGDD